MLIISLQPSKIPLIIPVGLNPRRGTDMKINKHIYIASFFAIVSVAALSSCTKVETKTVEEEQTISFQAVIGRATKAAESVKYPEDVPFKTVAYWNDSNDGRLVSSVEYIPESNVSLRGNQWSTSTEYNWPYAGALTFLAYSPASLNLGTNMNFGISMSGGKYGANVLSIQNWDSEAVGMKDVDFMVADIQTNKSSNTAAGAPGNSSSYNGVPMIFRHMLTKISVSAVTTAEAEAQASYKILSVKLKIFTKGNYSAIMPATSPEQQWGDLTHLWLIPETLRPSPALTDVVIYEDDGYSPADDMIVSNTEQLISGKSYLAVPQNLSYGQELIISYAKKDSGSSSYVKVEEALTYTLSHFDESTAWERGKEIHYKLVFDLKKPIMFDGSANDWTEGGEITI